MVLPAPTPAGESGNKRRVFLPVWLRDIMSNIDAMFSPGGFAVALNHGCELTVYLGDSILSGVTVSHDDLSCSRCDRPIDTPTRNPAKFIAANTVFRDGLCRRCDPIVGPVTPPGFDP